MERQRPNDPPRHALQAEQRQPRSKSHAARGHVPRGSPADPLTPHDHAARISSALLLVTLELRHPRHRLADELARRTFFDVGFAALCRCGHPVRRTGEDHLALYQLLDWPREHGRTIAEDVLRALECRRSVQAAAPMEGVDADLVHSFTDARLTLVRTTSRAGKWLGFEELATGRMLRGSVPRACTVGVGDTLLTRFAETRLGHHVPIADLLVVPRGAVRDFDARRRDPDGPRGPDTRSTEAARLFRAWTLVAFGNGAGVIDPRDHTEALGS